MLEFLDQVQRNFIRNLGISDRKTLFSEMLKGALNATESQCGFIGEILYTEENPPYLKILAISDILNGGEPVYFCGENVLTGSEFASSKTLFGEVVSTGEPVISNLSITDPGADGLPPEYPNLSTCLGMPFRNKDALTGMIGLANRPDGYDQEFCDSLRPIWATCETMIGAYRVFERRKQAEAEIIERERHISAILNTTVDSIINMNEEGIVDTFNSSAEKLFGYSAEEVIGNNVKMLMPEPDRSRHDSYLSKYSRTGKKNIIGIGREVTAVTKTGKLIAIQLAIGEWKRLGKRMYVGVLHDVSERREMELQQIQMAEEKSKFAAIVSHELRTPMAAMAGGIKLLLSPKTGELNEIQEEIVGIVDKNIMRLSRLVNDFLDFQKLETRTIELNFSRHNVNNLVQDVFDAMSFHADAKNLELVLDTDKSLPLINCDGDKIIQVITNFVNNAVKFTDGGQITIRTARTDDKHVTISVSDHGVGISNMDQKKLFKPFEQISNVEKGKPLGSGMGLAISKLLVERHRGRIGLNSKPGEGSTFYFIIPVDKGGLVD